MKGLAVTVTSVTYENKKSKKHQNEGVPPIRPARVKWKKRILLNLNDECSKNIRVVRQRILHLFMDDDKS